MDIRKHRKPAIHSAMRVDEVRLYANDKRIQTHGYDKKIEVRGDRTGPDNERTGVYTGGEGSGIEDMEYLRSRGPPLRN